MLTDAVCLGMLYTKATLANLEDCAHCRLLRKLTLQRVFGGSAGHGNLSLSKVGDPPKAVGLRGRQHNKSVMGRMDEVLHQTEYTGTKEEDFNIPMNLVPFDTYG